MPLIESGTYTVNRRPASAAAKKLSKFTLWKHWRRSVQHEDSSQPQEKKEPAQQRDNGGPPQEAGSTSRRGEVAGPQQPRRTLQQRPHSLAVQPLNYQRFDPELQLPEPRQPGHPQGHRQGGAPAAGGPRRPPPPPVVVAELVPVAGAPRRAPPHPPPPPPPPPGHPNMTSQESIGSCSLDVERSASERSDVNAGSLSEKTLHSLSISCNGDQSYVEETGSGGRKSGDGGGVGGGGASISNGHDDDRGELGDDAEQLTTRPTSGSKKPSYLGLACSINGYSGITRYDSKLREGFRSRDSSPGARLITRDTSPAGFRTNDNLSVGPQSLKVSPLAMDKRNGYSNGDSSNKCGGGGGGGEGYSEVDRGYPVEPKLSPIRAGSPNKKYSPVGARIASYNQQNNSRSSYSSISSSSPKSNLGHNASNSYNESSILNGSSDFESSSLNSSSEKSFIQQRVERLYGPDDSTSFIEESLKNLPVLRHLRPEFRAQLPVVSPRKPTDGTEQIIKPLKRISIPSVKNDAKEVKEKPVTIEAEVTIDPQMTASVTSLTDQQPAAPKVVLPVDPVEYQASTPKRTSEAPKAVQEKDGHYFISLLNKERERLIALAETAEAELENSEASNLPEDAAGKLRSGAGKARLLATQKMKQFEGLCQKNINQIPGEEFPTTSEDLAGFWDMVMLQVVQVNDLFEHIDRSRKLQWKDVQEPSASSPQNGSASKRRQTPASKVKSSTNSEALRKAREAREQTRRQLLEERRRAMRANANKSDSAVEIFVPET